MRTPRLRRGIALMLTLMITLLLLILMTAFFNANRDQIQMRRQGDQVTRARAAALSGVEYARMRMEADPAWGLPGQDRDHGRSIDGMQIFEEDDVSSGGSRIFVCVGVLPQSDSHFQMSFVAPGTLLTSFQRGRFDDRSIAANPGGGLSAWATSALPARDVSLNYLGGESYMARLRLADGTAPERSLSPGQALLQVRGYCRGVVQTLDVSFGPEATSEASVKSGGRLSVDVSGDADNRWNIDTMRWEKNRIESGDTLTISGPGPANTRARFLSGQTPSAAADGAIRVTSGITGVAVQGSLLNIVYANTQAIDVARAGQNARGKFEPDAGVPPVSEMTRDSAESQLTQNGSARFEMPGGNYTFTNANTLTRQGGTSYSNEIRNGNQLVARVKNYQLVFQENVKVEFTGSATISGASGRPASVLMGYNRDNWLPSNSEGTLLKVNGGNLTINGSVSGSGAVMATEANGDGGDIRMQGKSQMSSDPDSGITMFADRNVLVTAPDPSGVDFFHFDIAAVSQGMNAYAPSGQNSKWDSTRGGNPPLNEFANLSSEDKDRHTQGGAQPIPDDLVGNTSIKTARIADSVAEGLKAQLQATFPALTSEEGAVQFNLMYDKFVTGAGGEIATPGLTVGRYLRLREFARDLQAASASGDPTPQAATSAWGDVTQRNEILNDKLKAEIGFFTRQARAMDKNLHELMRMPNSSNPAQNPLTATMNNRDARWTGLMYARGSIWVDNGGGRLDVRGSMMARNDVAVTNATGVTTVYDPRYLRNLSSFGVGSKTGTKLGTYFYRVR